MKMFILRCESAECRHHIRTVTVSASNSEEALEVYDTSMVAPFPQMREKGYVPISVREV